MVFLALKKISAWDLLLEYLEQEDTGIEMVPGHQRVNPTETKAQLTTALAKQMKMWTQSGREKEVRFWQSVEFQSSVAKAKDFFKKKKTKRI